MKCLHCDQPIKRFGDSEHYQHLDGATLKCDNGDTIATPKLKRYALFSGDYYYPTGGWDDLVDTFDTLEEALAAHTVEEYTWFHVIDLTSGEEVAH